MTLDATESSKTWSLVEAWDERACILRSSCGETNKPVFSMFTNRHAGFGDYSQAMLALSLGAAASSSGPAALEAPVPTATEQLQIEGGPTRLQLQNGSPVEEQPCQAVVAVQAEGLPQPGTPASTISPGTPARSNSQMFQSPARGKRARRTVDILQ